MVLEVARFAITPGSEEAFVAAYAEAIPLVSVTPGFGSARMLRGVERPDTFVLLVEWDSVESHQVFRDSERFPEWRARIGPHFASPPEVEHATDL